MMIIDPVLRPNFIRSLKPFDTVIIDPGHGGADPGAVNALGSEKDYTLAVARILSKALEGEGFKVVMTRDADLTLSNTERVKIANREGANAIFISIHFKSKPDGTNRGIETFTCSYAGEDVNARKPRKGMGEQSASIALAVAVHGTCTLKTGLPDGGIRRINTSVLAGIGHPAILLVGGYMSNAEDARLINRVDYQQALAQSIVLAALRYNNAIR